MGSTRARRTGKVTAMSHRHFISLWLVFTSDHNKNRQKLFKSVWRKWTIFVGGYRAVSPHEAWHTERDQQPIGVNLSTDVLIHSGHRCLWTTKWKLPSIQFVVQRFGEKWMKINLRRWRVLTKDDFLVINCLNSLARPHRTRATVHQLGQISDRTFLLTAAAAEQSRAAAAHGNRSLTDRTKAMAKQQSDQHDGVVQIHGYFYSS